MDRIASKAIEGLRRLFDGNRPTVGTFAALAIITVAEATIGVFVKLIGNEVPILALNFYRALFAALFLAATLPLFHKGFWHFPKNNLKDTAIIGLLIAAQFSIFNYAMTVAPIANVVIFWSVSPFFAFIFSRLFLGERAKTEHVIIFIIAMIGIAVANPLRGGYLTGNLLALASAAVYAALVTYMRYEGKTEVNSDIFWSLAIAALLLLPGLFISSPGDIFGLSAHGPLPFAVPTLVWVVLLGMFSTGLAYLLISVALKQISANLYSLVDTIASPVIAALFGFLIFREVPEVNTVYGGAILLVSAFWLTRSLRKSGKQEEVRVRQ